MKVFLECFSQVGKSLRGFKIFSGDKGAIVTKQHKKDIAEDIFNLSVPLDNRNYTWTS